MTYNDTLVIGSEVYTECLRDGTARHAGRLIAIEAPKTRLDSMGLPIWDNVAHGTVETPGGRTAVYDIRDLHTWEHVVWIGLQVAAEATR